MELQKKKKLIKKRTQNKRNCNYKNEDQIQQKKRFKIKWLGIKSRNKIQ
jgi:hypothetical protein